MLPETLRPTLTDFETSADGQRMVTGRRSTGIDGAGWTTGRSTAASRASASTAVRSRKRYASSVLLSCRTGREHPGAAEAFVVL